MSPRREFISSRQGNKSYAGVGAFGRNQNLVGFNANAKLGPFANAVLIFLLVALLGLIYLMQLSKTGSYSYEINDINQKKTQLAAEQDNLKVENARLQSLNNIKNSEVAKAMVAPASTNYAE